MNPNKAPGPDGVTPNFFQKYWHIVDKDIFLAVQQFFPSGRLLKSFNHTLVSLIPKVSNAANIKQLRPISL